MENVRLFRQVTETLLSRQIKQKVNKVANPASFPRTVLIVILKVPHPRKPSVLDHSRMWVTLKRIDICILGQDINQKIKDASPTLQKF